MLLVHILLVSSNCHLEDHSDFQYRLTFEEHDKVHCISLLQSNLLRCVTSSVEWVRQGACLRQAKSRTSLLLSTVGHRRVVLGLNELLVFYRFRSNVPLAAQRHFTKSPIGSCLAQLLLTKLCVMLVT